VGARGRPKAAGSEAGKPGHRGRGGADCKNAPRPGDPSKPRAACAGGRASSPPAPLWTACTATGRYSCPGAHKRRHSTHRTPSLRAAPGPPPRVTTHQTHCLQASLPRLTFHEGLRPAAPPTRPWCICLTRALRGEYQIASIENIGFRSPRKFKSTFSGKHLGNSGRLGPLPGHKVLVFQIDTKRKGGAPRAAQTRHRDGIR